MTDELLIKFLLKEATTTEAAQIQAWLDEAPANTTYFKQFEKIWQSSKQLALRSEVDEVEAWKKFKAKTAQQAVVVPLKSNFNWLKIAAVLVVIAGIWMTYSRFSKSNYTELAANTQVVTEHLPDGSEITLNKNSKISYASDFSTNRKLKLSTGDVFFQVTHDKQHPFVISMDKVSVTVVGTAFNIKYLKGKTEVIVEEGIVRVALGDEELLLYKGEKLQIDNSTTKLLKAKNTDQLYTYYRSQLFMPNNTPLYQLAEVLAEAYGEQIIVDNAVRNETITTTLKAQADLTENLKTIAETLDLKITHQHNQILLSKNK